VKSTHCKAHKHIMSYQIAISQKVVYNTQFCNIPSTFPHTKPKSMSFTFTVPQNLHLPLQIHKLLPFNSSPPFAPQPTSHVILTTHQSTHGHTDDSSISSWQPTIQHSATHSTTFLHYLPTIPNSAAISTETSTPHHSEQTFHNLNIP